jgi:integrase
LRISAKLTDMINALHHKDQNVFGGARLQSMKVCLGRQRKRIAKKVQNPRIEKITFHTLRHWKATWLYHENRDILYVMKSLGHKDVKNTLIYIDLETAC